MKGKKVIINNFEKDFSKYMPLIKNILSLYLIILSFNGMSQSADKSEFYVEKYFNLSISEGERFMFESTIKETSKQIQMDESNYNAYFERAMAYAELGIYVNAIKDYSQAITLNPSFGEAYYNRALAKGRFGYNKEACSDLRKAVELGVVEAKEIYDMYCNDY